MTTADTRLQQKSPGASRRKGRRASRRGNQAECRGSCSTVPCRQRKGCPPASDTAVQGKNTSKVKSQAVRIRKSASETAPGRAEAPLAEPTHPTTRRVSFDLKAGTEHEITPYAEIYGFHPSEFQFESNDFLLLLTSDESECDEDEDDDDEEQEVGGLEDDWVLVHRD